MTLPAEPTRWRDGPQGETQSADPIQERAGVLVRSVDEPSPLSGQALTRIRQAIPSGRVRRRAGGRIAGLVGLRPGFVAIVVLASAATAGGTGVLWRKYAHQYAPRETPVAARKLGGIAQPRPLSPPPAGEVSFGPRPSPEPSPSDVPSLAPVIEHPSSPHASSRAPGRTATARTVAVQDGTSKAHEAIVAIDQPSGSSNQTETETETHLLSEALGKLRRERDPRGAALTLDRYDLLFPRGLLAAEARRVRLEALVYAGDHRAALRLLEEDPRRFGEPLALDLLLLRAEFRAELGRCDQALADFSHVIDQVPSGDAVERALYGRAVCWGKTGQDLRARADLTTYRFRFPHGRFSSEAARLLDRGRTRDSP